MKSKSACTGIYHKQVFKLIIPFVLMAVIPVGSLFAQDKDSLYYKNFVVNSDGTYNSLIPPDVSFTVYLNKDEDNILLENAPRWDPTGVPNIESNGTFGVELANFTNPDIKVGDSVFVRFTNSISNEQGILRDEISSIPFFSFPQTLKLESTSLPQTPQFTSIEQNIDGTITIEWKPIPNVVFDIYRTSLSDTLENGLRRNLYKRIAKDFVGTIFSDENVSTGETYEYIIYSINQSGIKSAHSSGLLSNTGKILNLTSHARPTSVILNWSDYTDKNNEIAGYNIYRRKIDENYTSPVGYTGSKNFFIDSRLETNTKYFYTVKARTKEGNETAFSDEVEVTTLPSKSGYYAYATLRTAVVIYKNTTRGQITEGNITTIKRGLDLGRAFYWRNSGMKLNIEFDYIIIDELVDFPNPNDSWGSMLLTAKHLEDMGVKNTQYDIVFRISAAVNGYWSYGAPNLDMPGPERNTGFSQIQWPVGTGVNYPGASGVVSYGSTWVFVHEVQHALDAIFDNYSHPDENTIMYHGDVPWMFPVACGEHYDFQAKMFRHYKAYEYLEEDWGEIYESIDSDNDGFPDSDSLVILDENRFGSSSETSDSDNDGYNDKSEAIDGTYSGSSPVLPDTDDDGITDGNDTYPRYPVKTNIKKFTPVIDGTIDDTWELNNNTVVFNKETYKPELYLSYDDNYLYLGLKIYNGGEPEIYFDFNNDGFWYGAGNTEIIVDVNSGTFKTFRSRDASHEVREYALANNAPGGYWDDDPEYQNQFNRRVIHPDSVKLEVSKNGHIAQIEMAIPKNEYAGINLSQGDKYGLNIYYRNANGDPGQYASTFDQYSFVYFEIGGVTYIEKNDTVVNNFFLEQNYPNPFNPVTKIKFTIPVHNTTELQDVILKVYDVLGREVATLVSGTKLPGTYEVVFDASNLSSGMYFYKLTAGNYSSTKKMLLVK